MDKNPWGIENPYRRGIDIIFGPEDFSDLFIAFDKIKHFRTEPVSKLIVFDQFEVEDGALTDIERKLLGGCYYVLPRFEITTGGDVSKCTLLISDQNAKPSAVVNVTKNATGQEDVDFIPVGNLVDTFWPTKEAQMLDNGILLSIIKRILLTHSDIHEGEITLESIVNFLAITATGRSEQDLFIKEAGLIDEKLMDEHLEDSIHHQSVTIARRKSFTNRMEDGGSTDISMTIQEIRPISDPVGGIHTAYVAVDITGSIGSSYNYSIQEAVVSAKVVLPQDAKDYSGNGQIWVRNIEAQLANGIANANPERETFGDYVLKAIRPFEMSNGS